MASAGSNAAAAIQTSANSLTVLQTQHNRRTPPQMFRTIDRGIRDDDFNADTDPVVAVGGYQQSSIDIAYVERIERENAQSKRNINVLERHVRELAVKNQDLQSADRARQAAEEYAAEQRRKNEQLEKDRQAAEKFAAEQQRANEHIEKARKAALEYAQEQQRAKEQLERKMDADRIARRQQREEYERDLEERHRQETETRQQLRAEFEQQQQQFDQ